MSFWRRKVAKQGLVGDTGRPINQTYEENPMQPPDSFINIKNMERKSKRAEAANSTSDLDALAAEMRATGVTWQVIAEQLGYANGAIARRAALRHQTRQQSPA